MDANKVAVDGNLWLPGEAVPWKRSRKVVLYTPVDQVDISENRGTSKSSIKHRVFHYKSSILVYPYFWKHPNGNEELPIFNRQYITSSKGPFSIVTVVY